MTNPAWSPAVADVDPSALAPFSATVWRRAPPEADATAAHCADHEAEGLARWLAEAGPALQVELRIVAQSSGPVDAFLGLHARAHSPEEAAQLHARGAAELGEALDHWRLFPAAEAPPALPPAAIGFAARGPLRANLPDWSPQDGPASGLISVVTALAAQQGPLTLRARLRSLAVGAPLIDDLRQTFERALQRRAAIEMGVTGPDPGGIIARVDQLQTEAGRAELLLSLHAEALPGRLLQHAIAARYQELLGAPVQLAPAGARVELPGGALGWACAAFLSRPGPVGAEDEGPGPLDGPPGRRHGPRPIMVPF